MKLVIMTQCQENYGAHNWDGKGECPQYWKNKGGEIYVVNGIPADQDEFAKLIDKVVAYASRDDVGYKEYPISQDVYADHHTPWEEWEYPWILTPTDEGFNVERTHSNDDVSIWKESFKALPDGERVVGTYRLTPMNDAARHMQAEYDKRLNEVNP